MPARARPVTYGRWMPWARRAGVAGLLLLGIGGAVAAAAQSEPMIIDHCFGVDHPPFQHQPPPGANSILLWAGAFSDLREPGDAVLTVEDPGGATLTGTGSVDETARSDILVGIKQYGTHTVRGLEVTYRSGGTLSIAGAAGMAFTVGPDEPACSSSQLPEGSFAAPAESTTTTTAATTTTEPTTTTTVATTTTEPQSTVTTIVVSEDKSGSFREIFYVPILIGTVLIIVGIVVYYRTRERPRRSAGDESGPGQPPPTPVPPGGLTATPHDHPAHAGCDWAAYYDDGTQRIPLREAKGHECCVYVVKVSSSIGPFDFASKVRQDAGDDRLRIFDASSDFNGLDIHAWTSARTAAAGTLDWVQADVPVPPGVTPDLDYEWRFPPHSEPPDVAIHLAYADTTAIGIELESECPDHLHAYRTSATSRSFLQANQECTNTMPGPECPVELTASSYSTVVVGGDLTYDIAATGASDVDELDAAGASLRGNHVDSHEHDTTPRSTFEGALTNGGNVHKHGDSWFMTVGQYVLLDAGAIVPVAVSATTDRVTADSYVRFEHDIGIGAEMESVCTAACCGNGPCACAPELQLSFTAGGATITCDGSTFTLSRNTAGVSLGMALGADMPWELG